jgi:hypothetical protein
MALYYDTTQYTSGDDFFAALATVTNFWDSVTEDTLTKGDVTLTYSSGTITLAAGGFSTAMNFSAPKGGLIAATAKGLMAAHFPTDTNNRKVIAVACDKNGVWGGSISNHYTVAVNEILATGLTSKSYSSSSSSNSTFTSNTNTQIIDLVSDKGNFIFDDLRRVLYTTSAVVNYNGKLTMPNGEKYVKCGAFVLRYTE